MTASPHLPDHWAVLLTTYRRDGTPVGVPVSLAVEGDRGYLRSPGTAWKVRRLRRNPHAKVAPCTPRGHPVGAAVDVVARELDGDEARRAAAALRRRYPILQGVLVPLAHRALRCGTVHFEIRPACG